MPAPQSQSVIVDFPDEEKFSLAEIDLPAGYRVIVRAHTDHSPKEETGGVVYQKCGGGRRIIRKPIGSN